MAQRVRWHLGKRGVPAAATAAGCGRHARGRGRTHVKCASPAWASESHEYWRTKLEWSIGAMPRKPAGTAVVNAMRAAFGEWTNNRNYSRLPDRSDFAYEGRSTRRYADDGYNTVDWGSMAGIQGCVGSLACTEAWYLEGGGAVQADIRFNNHFRWIAGRSTGGYDIQMMAAHEIGHALQFDHVSSPAKRRWTNVMWPYEQKGDKSGRLLGKGDSLGDNAGY